MPALPCADPFTRDSLFFSPNAENQRLAAAKCFDCPIMDECAKLGESEEYGVWGGTTEEDRDLPAIRRAKRTATIYRMLSQGASNEEIAQEVEMHKRSIQRARAVFDARNNYSTLAA